VQDEVTISVRLPRAHSEKLRDIASHDGTSRSYLIRRAIARLLNGRKAVLYGGLTCKVMLKDSFGQYRKCDDCNQHREK
jgi:metal-responsive CopG/Arc/MetJ family transcriptional regulator